MDRETLSSPEVQQLMLGGLVAVKVNSDQHPNLVQQYRVEALPCDVVLSPDGKILYKREGYQNRGKYVGGLTPVVAQFQNSKQTTIAARPVTPEPVHDAHRRVPAVPASSEATGAAQPSGTDLPAPERLAIGGYCPVALYNSRAWKRGQPALAHVYEGQTYHLLDQASRDAFIADPARFAPRLLGCDPVIYTDADLAVAGDPKFGAYYDGSLYLFQSAESRAKFRNNPLRYTRPQQVRLEDIGRKRV